MLFQDENQCVIFLVGYLSTMPVLSTESNEYQIKVSRYRHCKKKYKNTIETYTVVVSGELVQSIIDFGFPGALISIQGDLSINEEAKILAQKINFLDKSSANQENISFVFNTENNIEQLALKKNRLFYLAQQTGWVH